MPAFGCSTTAATVSTAGDILTFFWATGTVVAKWLQMFVSQSAVTAIHYDVRIRRLATQGTGGTDCTEEKFDPASAAPNYVVQRNPSTPATPEGDILLNYFWRIGTVNPVIMVFQGNMLPTCRSNVDPEGLAIKMASTPGAETYIGWIEWQEA